MPRRPRQRARETHTDRVHGLSLADVLDAVEREPSLLMVRQRLGINRVRTTKRLLGDLGLLGPDGRLHDNLDERLAAYRRRYDV
jgi:hypothetical protein